MSKSAIAIYDPCVIMIPVSESDVYRRQILTTEVDPRTVKGNTDLYKIIHVE